MKIGQKAVLVVDIPTADGMIYKDTTVKISDIEDIFRFWHKLPKIFP